MRLIRYILGIFSIFACTAACINNPFKPLPPLFQRWEKYGSSLEMVKTELVSCGFDNPYDGFNKYKDGIKKEITWNDSAKAYICMEEKGFRNWILGHPICSDSDFKDIPACLNRRETTEDKNFPNNGKFEGIR